MNKSVFLWSRKTGMPIWRLSGLSRSVLPPFQFQFEKLIWVKFSVVFVFRMLMLLHCIVFCNDYIRYEPTNQRTALWNPQPIRGSTLLWCGQHLYKIQLLSVFCRTETVGRCGQWAGLWAVTSEVWYNGYDRAAHCGQSPRPRVSQWSVPTIAKHQ